MGTIGSPLSVSRRNAVHPHGRGDNGRAYGWVERCVGSPPRAWGQSARRSAAAAPRRFTPTGVGTMLEALDDELAPAVHPHGRGDNGIRPERGEYIRGSPPRAWGQLQRALRGFQLPRFTPTGVGTISTASTTRRTRAVHPHGRGDNVLAGTPKGKGDGSPPRAWGQSIWRENLIPALRFTPTGVGTMIAHPQRRRILTVHPHGRGDNDAAGECAGVAAGSPPRAWGQSHPLPAFVAPLRFTPTGVGTISGRRCWKQTISVHPHGRGDNRQQYVYRLR